VATDVDGEIVNATARLSDGGVAGLISNSLV